MRTLTAKSASGATSQSRGSEVIISPAPMTAESTLPNFSGRSLSTSIALPPSDRAMRADMIVMALRPNVLEKRTRMRGPPTETCITWRSVLPARPGAGGMFLGSVSCGDADQVPSQCGLGAGSGAECLAQALAATMAHPKTSRRTRERSPADKTLHSRADRPIMR